MLLSDKSRCCKRGAGVNLFHGLLQEKEMYFMHTNQNGSLCSFLLLVADPRPSSLLSEAEEQCLARERQGSGNRIRHIVI